MPAAGSLARLKHESSTSRAPALGVLNTSAETVEVKVVEVYDSLFGVGGVRHSKGPLQSCRAVASGETWLWGYGTPREDHRGQDTGGFWITLDASSPPLSAGPCRVSEVRLLVSPRGDDRDYEEFRVRVAGGEARELATTLLKAYGACKAFATAEAGDAAALEALPPAELAAAREDGARPIHAAAHGGHVQALRALLRARVDANAAYRSQVTYCNVINMGC